jgi:hypothetical protein
VKDESNGWSAATEAVMVDQDKPKPKIVLGGHTKGGPIRASTELPTPKPTRSQEELKLLALRVTENAALMQRFHSVIGSDDKARASEVMDEITRYVQSIDPSISVSEGTTIVVLLMKIVGLIKGEIDG